MSAAVLAKLCALRHRLDRFDGEFQSVEPLLQSLDDIIRDVHFDDLPSPSHSRDLTDRIPRQDQRASA